ncbi:hypothetical protein CB1_000844017 [Camelus ferus]|nr:hypothetical protein CB1_000844017 [Camelus ferus]
MTQIEPPRSAAYKGSDGHDFRPRKKASLIVTEPPSISGEGPPSGRAKPTGSGYFLNTQTRAASEEWELGTGLQKRLLHLSLLSLIIQSYPGPSLESEDFNIPPITPPSLPDHSLVHLNEVEPGYHSLCHPMNHNGLLPFHPQNMDLPEITVSNMLGQDGALLPGSISVVSGAR